LPTPLPLSSAPNADQTARRLLETWLPVRRAAYFWRPRPLIEVPIDLFKITSAKSPTTTCSVTTADSVSAGVWSHVSGSYNGQSIAVSVNNSWIEAPCDEGPIATTDGTPLNMGAAAGNANPYNGLIDEIRGWAHATPSSFLYSGYGSLYRWNVWSSYNQWQGWFNGNDAALYGGVNPSNWGDNNGIAASMSSTTSVLRTLFTRQGPRLTQDQGNASVVTDEWYSYSSTNSKHVGVLFRVQNTTSNPIDWSACWYKTSYGGWGEKASIALNGTNVWDSGGNNYGGASSPSCHALTIPAARTSTVIFVSGSTPVGGGTRGVTLAFYNNSLTLPTGLRFVDDLDVKGDGWDK